MKANKLLKSHRRTQALVAAAAARTQRAAERSERRAKVGELDDALRDLGGRRQAGRVSEEQFLAERQRLLSPIAECPMLL